VGEPIQKGYFQVGVAKKLGPVAKAEIAGDDGSRVFVVVPLFQTSVQQNCNPDHGSQTSQGASLAARNRHPGKGAGRVGLQGHAFQ